MDTLKQKTKLIKKSIGRLLKWLLGAMLGLLISAFVALQIPYVQNHLFGKLLQYLSHTTQFPITHQRFQLKWLYHASLTGLTIKDPQDNTMLAVDQLALKINPLQLLRNMYITLRTLRIQGAQVHLRKEGQEGYNMHVFLRRLVAASKLGPDAQQASLFVIESASLQDIAFSLDDQQAVPLQDAFDTQHFTIHRISAELANLKVRARTLAVDIRHFTGRHADRPLFVDHFSTFLVVAPDSIQCKALQLRTECSTLEGNCTVTYDPLMPLAAFKDHAHIIVDLTKVVVAAEELAVFVPYFRQYKSSYTFSGTMDGKVNDLRIKDFQLGFGEHGSHFEGCLSLQGLPSRQELVFNMELQQGVLHTLDLLPYLDEKYYKRIAQFNLVKTKGRFYGTLADFIAKASFDTDLGEVITDLEVQVDPVSMRTMYRGAITTCDFELGTWLSHPAMQQLTMQGQIDGEGLSWEAAHFQLEANIHKLGFNNYVYENIYAHGHFARAFFQGKLTVNDPHLKLRADVAINLNRDTESIAVQGVLDKACLQALRLTDRRATLCTQLSIAMQGLSWDDIKADAQLNQFCFDLEGREIRLDTLHIHADQSNLGRLLTIDSALLAFRAEGDFSYSSLASDLNQFIRAYQCRLMHIELPPPKYARRPYTLACHLHCKDINPLLCIFGIDAYASPNIQLEVSFSQQEEASFSLRFAEAATFAFKKNRWESTQLELSARQSKDGQEISAVVQLASKEQQWGKFNTTEDLALAISWKNDQLEFSGSLGQQESPHRVNLQGQAVILDGAIEISITPAQEERSDNQWCVHPKNLITLGRSWIRFQNFVFYKGLQQVSLVGTLSADPAEVLRLRIKDCLLESLNPFVNQQLTGVLNAAVVLQGTLSQPYLDSDITLDNLTVDSFLVGSVHAQTSWNNALQRLNMTCQVDYLKQQTVTIQGCYEPLKEANSLQLTANFLHAPLAALAPFVANHLSQLAGELNGTVYIHGSPANPSVTGEASITEAVVTINYFNTCYQVSGALTFADQAIHITTLHLSDDQQGKAVLQGSIAHKGFEDFQIDAQGSMTNFKLLNTTTKDNEFFYGTGILSGGLTASGPLKNMAVYLKAKTDPGTHIFIPMLTAENTVVQYDFIRFVNLKTRYQDKAEQTQQSAFKGFKLMLLLEITPDARAAFILNAKTGDAIAGRGQGNIQLEVDPEGVLTMAGEFEFLEGEYNLSLYRIVNSTFKILPQSKITWYGSPAQGILDIKAVYEQRAALETLLEDSSAVGQGKSKYPVQVLVGLQGALLSPTKSFSVNFPEYPSELATVVNEFNSKAEQDKKYVENQVLHLLIFKEFAHRNITNPGSKLIGRNFSALASQQLSSLTSNLDDNLEVNLDMDLTALENKKLDASYLNLSYRLTDRLWVSRQSGLLGTTEHASSTARLIGDWTAEYSLTKDGRLRAKLYNKYTTHTAYKDTGGATTFAGGLGLLYVKSFNQWRELVRGNKQAVKEKAPKNSGEK